MIQEGLTSREQEVFDLLLDGNSLKEIACTLNVAYTTIDFHKGNIYQKLGVHNVRELRSLNKKAEDKQSEKTNSANENTKQKRFKLTAAALISALVVSICFNGYFLNKSKPFASEPFASKQSASPTQRITLTSPENPLVLTFWENYPYGWMYLYNPVEFINHKISERDIYRFDYTFTSNEDFDFFMILLSDGTILYDEEPYVFRLSPTMNLNRQIKANKEYSGSIFINTTNTASSTKPLANQFELHANSRIRGTMNNQIIMTFTKFEIIKIN